MTMNKEVRSLEFEIRAEETGSEERAGRLTGTPIVFNQVTDLGWIREMIEPGALDNADLKDVRFLVGHDTSGIPLARSRNNNANSTMQLTVTERGMEIRVDLDTENNAEARALYSAVQRGDMSGMSFMFTVDTNKDIWEDTETEYPKRTIMSIRKVYEVSAVAFPAYPQTDIQAASEGESLESVRASLESAKQKLAEERAAQAEAERRRAVMERLEAEKVRRTAVL
jgi:HK97 family phage prohead protease